MTSPQQPQPQPQPERGPDDTGAQQQPLPAAPPVPPAAPHPPQGRPPQAPPAAPAQPGQQPPQQQPGQQPPPAGEAGTMMLQAQQPPAQPSLAKEPGTMTLQAQQAPGQPAPAREAGTMMLQPQQPAEPQPLAAHGPGRDAGTMMLQQQGQPPAQPQAPAPPQHQQHHPQAQQPPAPQQAHPQQAWAGAGGYVSPIPVRPTHLGHALASEWTKIRSLRSTIWTLGVMVVLTVGIGLLASLAAGSEREMDPLLGVGFVGVLLGSLCVITLGVLSISSEYGTGMIRTTLTACPSRVRVLTAKAVVFFTLALVLTTVATTLVALLDTAMLNGPAPTTDQWLRATLGAGLYVALLGLLALAVGALLRHSAGAISSMMGVVLLPMLLALFLQGDSVKDIQRTLIEYSVPSALATLYDIPFLPTGPTGWTPLWILAGVTAVVLGGAYAAVAQRDV
ncbi:ABC-type transport system involved in multi-copper enzyme maturation, permease component [Streptomyces sp. 2323.1]|uniref:ABC transporter permease subunit n=1 Tax=Streptomyces sp. 2323.1 TaxID=1938841 RepID=UPI000BBF511C|nr:ABC-type transport system involved in multi-copper enzyme maturation, permease component [Streptomyces sp. 2323.1]